MSYVISAPEMMTAGATDLATIGATLDAAHTAAATPTLALAPAAADEVSVGIAHLLSRHAQDYQAVAMKAAASQEQFVQNLKVSAVSYASIEDAIASLLNRFSTSIANALFGLSEIPYVLANLDEFLPYLLSLVVFAPIVLGLVGIVFAIAAVATLIQIITSVLGSV